MIFFLEESGSEQLSGKTVWDLSGERNSCPFLHILILHISKISSTIWGRATTATTKNVKPSETNVYYILGIYGQNTVNNEELLEKKGDWTHPEAITDQHEQPGLNLEPIRKQKTRKSPAQQEKICGGWTLEEVHALHRSKGLKSSALWYSPYNTCTKVRLDMVKIGNFKCHYEPNYQHDPQSVWGKDKK